MKVRKNRPIVDFATYDTVSISFKELDDFESESVDIIIRKRNTVNNVIVIPIKFFENQLNRGL